jgi:uncharacterized protein YjbI with pentapeptide repeats
MTQMTRQQLGERMSELLKQHLIWLETDGQAGQRLNARSMEPQLEAHNSWMEARDGGVRLDLRLADLRRADLRGVDISRANLDLADLRQAELQGATLIGAKLRYADLGRANLERIDLRGADMRNAALEGAELSHADLRGVNLRSADLHGVVLHKADLSNGRLDLGDLEDADLSDASLSMAEMRIAHLCEANLSGTQFGLANLSEADFSGAHLEAGQLRDAIGRPARGCCQSEGEDKLRRLIQGLEDRLLKFETHEAPASEPDRAYRQALEKRLQQLRERLSQVKEGGLEEAESELLLADSLDDSLEVFDPLLADLDRSSRDAAHRSRGLARCGAMLWGGALVLMMPLFFAVFRDAAAQMHAISPVALLGAPLLAFLMGNLCLRRAEREDRLRARLQDRKNRCDGTIALLRAEARLGDRESLSARLAGGFEALRQLLLHGVESPVDEVYGGLPPGAGPKWTRLFKDVDK